MRQRAAYGDWQTPAELAELALGVAASCLRESPGTVFEPTCGEGAFLLAAARQFPGARLAGWEINPAYADVARSRVPRVEVSVANVFEADWAAALRGLPEPIWIAGNPPWVTSAGLGAMGSANLPAKSNFKRLSGHDARTGKSNFDVSEWVAIRAIEALQAQRRGGAIAILCKSAVARRVIEHASREGWRVSPGGLWRIDSLRLFGASVDAVWFVCSVGAAEGGVWPVYVDLGVSSPASSIAWVDGTMVADLDRYRSTAFLAGRCRPEWRSGVKHDCAGVLELSAPATVEEEFVFPLLKGSDVARGRSSPRRSIILPQRTLGEDTSRLEGGAPRLWRYLQAHRGSFEARKSSIYRRQPPFAIFGVGPYTFAPWKLAICGLYKRLAFTVIGPHEGRPVILDDTCYFLPFDTEPDARAALESLRSPLATDFFTARAFWDSKRPITKTLLQALDLSALRKTV